MGEPLLKRAHTHCTPLSPRFKSSTGLRYVCLFGRTIPLCALCVPFPPRISSFRGTIALIVLSFRGSHHLRHADTDFPTVAEACAQSCTEPRSESLTRSAFGSFSISYKLLGPSAHLRLSFVSPCTRRGGWGCLFLLCTRLTTFGP